MCVYIYKIDYSIDFIFWSFHALYLVKEKPFSPYSIPISLTKLSIVGVYLGRDGSIHVTAMGISAAFWRFWGQYSLGGLMQNHVFFLSI